MQANIVLFIFFYISSALMVIGYGQLSKSLIISNQKNLMKLDLLDYLDFYFYILLFQLLFFFII